MQAQIEWSIPLTTEDRASWPPDDQPCPRCGEPLGDWKMVNDREADGTRIVVHKRCSDGSYLRG